MESFNNRYPVILIPEHIIEASKFQPSVQEIGNAYNFSTQKPTKPVEPLKLFTTTLEKKFRLKYFGYIGLPLSLLFLVNAFFQLLHESAISIFLFNLAISTVLFAFSFKINQIEIISEDEINSPSLISQTTKFHEDLKLYKTRLAKYNLQLEAFAKKHMNDYVNHYYQNHLMPNQYPVRIKTPKSIQRGRYEMDFLNDLIIEFGDNIQMDISYGERSYKPDFCYVCPHTKMHIDIEIDEPYFYDGSTDQPIHYKEVDRERNLFFLEKNWIIIRFSEFQIAEFSRVCIYIIKKSISSIQNRKKIPYGLFCTSYDEFWSYEQSLVMANLKYRNNYSKVNRLRIEKLKQDL